MKKAIAIYLLLLMTSGANAQFGMSKVEDIDKVARRKLLVVTEAPDEKRVKNYEKNGKTTELNNYKAYLEKYNADMKEVIEKHWPYNKKDIVYKTFDEAFKLAEQKNKSYVVLNCLAKGVRGGREEASLENQFKRGMHDVEDLDKMKMDDQSYSHFKSSMSINLVEDFGKVPVYQLTLPDILPGKSAILFGLRSMKVYFDSRILKEKDKDAWKALMTSLGDPTKMEPEKLKNSTLMIREDWLSSDLPAADVKKYYPYPVKICTEEELYAMMEDPKDNTALFFPIVYVMAAVEVRMYAYDAKTFNPITSVSDSKWTKVTKECLQRFMKSKK